jgi:GTP cyclohydrolase I
MIAPSANSINGINGINGTNGTTLAISAYEDLIREQLQMLGHNTDSNGLLETPQRVARVHLEHFNYSEDPLEDAALHLKPFDAPANPGLVSVRCSFSAFCEHHLLPFFGTAQVVYLPQEQITGLSKISRVVNALCKRPQIQERITSETAEVMMRLAPVGVHLHARARRQRRLLLHPHPRRHRRLQDGYRSAQPGRLDVGLR